MAGGCAALLAFCLLFGSARAVPSDRFRGHPKPPNSPTQIFPNRGSDLSDLVLRPLATQLCSALTATITISGPRPHNRAFRAVSGPARDGAHLQKTHRSHMLRTTNLTSSLTPARTMTGYPPRHNKCCLNAPISIRKSPSLSQMPSRAFPARRLSGVSLSPSPLPLQNPSTHPYIHIYTLGILRFPSLRGGYRQIETYIHRYAGASVTPARGAGCEKSMNQ